MGASLQRLDKWLWFARLVKTRTKASHLIQTGKVRVNRVKVIKPATLVHREDVITAMINHHLRVVRVIGGAQRRGPASEAQALYEDLTPENNLSGASDQRDRPLPSGRPKGAGRPTKRERRKIDAFRANPDAAKF